MKKVFLNEVAEITAGQGAPQKENDFDSSGMPFVRAGSLEDLIAGRSEELLERVGDEAAQRHRLKLFPKDTVLFAKSGMSAAKDRVYKLKQPAYVVSHLAAITPKEDLYPDYLMYFLRSFRPSRLIKDPSYPSISLSDIEKIEINKLEIVQQRLLAETFRKVESILEKRRQTLALADEFLKSVFLEMFGDPAKNPRKFAVVPCGTIALLVSSGSTPPGGEKTYLKEGILFIRSQNVLMNRLNLSDVAYISNEVHWRMNRTWVKKGDVLLNITGASIGRVAFFEGEDDTANVNQHVCIIRPDQNKVLPQYLSFLISMPNYQKTILGKNAGATRQAFNFDQIKRFQIPLAPMPEQQRFAGLVQRVEKLKEKQKQSETQLQNLFNALMQRAFRGDLFKG